MHACMLAAGQHSNTYNIYVVTWLMESQYHAKRYGRARTYIDTKACV